MLKVLKFAFVNAFLSLLDVSTDLATFFTLVDDHPLWAALTMTWMFTPFVMHALAFLFKISQSMWKTRTTDNLTILQRTGYTTCKELAGDFYSEAATHLPFVLPIHNLWRAKKLNDINYGKRTFRMKDSAEVEKIFSDAGKGSAAESTYEAGPQSVTQVLIVLSTGQYTKTQIISVITSVLSLSWGAARSFLIMRTADKADPDPDFTTVIIHIWPLCLVLTLAGLVLLVFLAGLIGPYIFFTLFFFFLSTYAVLSVPCIGQKRASEKL